MLNPGNNQKQKISLGYQFILIALFVVEAYQLYTCYRPNDIPWDTRSSYLVSAQHLVEQGWHFFTTEESLRYPPMTYLVYVPFLEHLELLRLLNNVLALSCLWLLYQLMRQFASVEQAVFAVFIYVTIPNLSAHAGQLMPEPSILFLTLVWLWATIKAITGKKKGYLMLAVIALVLATLTRAIYTYFIYFMIFSAALWLASGSRLPHHKAVKKLLIICLGALFLLWLFMLKNWFYFDTFTVANGMSGALYQGLHPFFGGIAPPVYGNDYDINGIAADHLSLLGEKRNMLAVKEIIKDRSFSEHIMFLLNKLYLVFFDYQISISRYWRLGLLPFFCYAFWYARPRKEQTFPNFIFFLVGILLIYQFAILIPILVLERYTVVITAISLAICGGYAYPLIWRSAGLKTVAILHVLAVLLMLGGLFDARQYKFYWPRINPNAYAPAMELNNQTLVNDDSIERTVKNNQITIKQDPAQIFITFKNPPENTTNVLLKLYLTVTEGNCHGKQYLGTYADKEFANPLLKRRFLLKSGTNVVRFGYASRAKKRLDVELLLHCDKGTQIQYNGIESFYDLTPSYLINKIDQQSTTK